ncbi:Cytochrome b5-like protein [Bienertia sinuspersici]
MALTKSLSFSLGRKRILIARNSSDLEQFCADYESFKPTKRHCSVKSNIMMMNVLAFRIRLRF